MYELKMKKVANMPTKNCTILSVYFLIMNVILTSVFRRVVRNNFQILLLSPFGL